MDTDWQTPIVPNPNSIFWKRSVCVTSLVFPTDCLVGIEISGRTYFLILLVLPSLEEGVNEK